MKQDKILDAHTNRNDPNRIRSAIQAALDTKEGERTLQGLLTCHACQRMFSARQAILDELEMWHPFLLQEKPMAAALGPSLVGYRSTGRSYYSKMLLDLVVVKMDFVALRRTTCYTPTAHM
ncbi:hypothetical protein N8I77_008630 [Diaporthe amygdali]|uniref:Uncharacterized protein n=1 Tax=Phomopsis amygdali TaxID=1214568 RepID=A0AAD9SB19_PHOAM|nr:hypothetical protein N8I77_008630 [Diaporthe amygdali]